MSSTRIAIFASGAGTNAQKIIDHFKNNCSVIVELVVYNKKNAGVLQIAQKENIPFIIIEKEKFFNGDEYVQMLKDKKIDFLILAGFLWKLPVGLIKAFPGKIINIHPALLPKYGGKGMYGMHVHRAVISNGETESGISIHYVNDKYDEGEVIEQHRCAISTEDTAETLAEKIHHLEHTFFPAAIEKLIKKR